MQASIYHTLGEYLQHKGLSNDKQFGSPAPLPAGSHLKMHSKANKAACSCHRIQRDS